MDKASLIILIIGSVLFLVAAFWPISKVFAERSPEKKLEIIMGSKLTWDIMQILFGIGALMAAIGMGMLAFNLEMLPNTGWLKFSALLLLIGSLFWIWHLYLRAVDPTSFSFRMQPVWHFATYTIFTQIGIAVAGYFLLNSPFANWIGWMLIIGMGTLLILTLIFKDMPPFVYYIFLIIASIALLKNIDPLKQSLIG